MTQIPKKEGEMKMNMIRIAAPLFVMLLAFSLFPYLYAVEPASSVAPASVGSLCNTLTVVQVFYLPANVNYPVNLYVVSDGSLATQRPAIVTSHIVVAHPLAGPITVRKGHCSDPQFGYSTTNSANYYGTQDNEKADQTFLQASIMIGMAMTDNNNWWYHIGIGNNVNNGNVHSGCANPPVIWGENAYGGTYYELPLQCGSYGTTYRLDIVADTTGTWWWFVNGNAMAGFYEGHGSNVYINSGGTIDFIEATSTPGYRSSSYTSTIFTNSLQYANSKINASTLSLSSTTFYNPSSISQYNSGWSTTYWSEQRSGSAPWSISYTWV